MMKITYQKANGETFERIRNSYCQYKVGDITSIGWRVLDIKYNFKNKYYSKGDYDDLVNKSINRYKKIDKIKKTFYNIYKESAYCMILLITFRTFEIMYRV